MLKGCFVAESDRCEAVVVEQKEGRSLDSFADGDGRCDQIAPGLADVRCDEDDFAGQSKDNKFEKLVGTENIAHSVGAHLILILHLAM